MKMQKMESKKPTMKKEKKKSKKEARMSSWKRMEKTLQIMVKLKMATWRMDKLKMDKLNFKLRTMDK